MQTISKNHYEWSSFWCCLPVCSSLKHCIVQLWVRIWKVELSPYYTQWILERSKCQNCDKNIQKSCLDRGPALRSVEDWFSRLHQSYFKLHDQRAFCVDKRQRFAFAMVENKLKPSTEEIAKSLKIDISIVFCHLKKLGSLQNATLDATFGDGTEQARSWAVLRQNCPGWWKIDLYDNVLQKQSCKKLWMCRNRE